MRLLLTRKSWSIGGGERSKGKAAGKVVEELLLLIFVDERERVLEIEGVFLVQNGPFWCGEERFEFQLRGIIIDGRVTVVAIFGIVGLCDSSNEAKMKPRKTSVPSLSLLLEKNYFTVNVLFLYIFFKIIVIIIIKNSCVWRNLF